MVLRITASTGRVSRIRCACVPFLAYPCTARDFPGAAAGESVLSLGDYHMEVCCDPEEGKALNSSLHPWFGDIRNILTLFKKGFAHVFI